MPAAQRFVTPINREADVGELLDVLLAARGQRLEKRLLAAALNVWLGDHAWLVVVHLTVGALLWISLVYFDLLVLGAPQPAEAAAKARPSPQPAAAGRTA